MKAIFPTALLFAAISILNLGLAVAGGSQGQGGGGVVTDSGEIKILPSIQSPVFTVYETQDSPFRLKTAWRKLQDQAQARGDGDTQIKLSGRRTIVLIGSDRQLINLNNSGAWIAPQITGSAQVFATSAEDQQRFANVPVQYQSPSVAVRGERIYVNRELIERYSIEHIELDLLLSLENSDLAKTYFPSGVSF